MVLIVLGDNFWWRSKFNGQQLWASHMAGQVRKLQGQPSCKSSCFEVCTQEGQALRSCWTKNCCPQSQLEIFSIYVQTLWIINCQPHQALLPLAWGSSLLFSAEIYAFPFASNLNQRASLWNLNDIINQRGVTSVRVELWHDSTKPGEALTCDLQKDHHQRKGALVAATKRVKAFHNHTRASCYR